MDVNTGATNLLLYPLFKMVICMQIQSEFKIKILGFMVKIRGCLLNLQIFGLENTLFKRRWHMTNIKEKVETTLEFLSDFVSATQDILE